MVGDEVRVRRGRACSGSKLFSAWSQNPPMKSDASNHSKWMSLGHLVAIKPHYPPPITGAMLEDSISAMKSDCYELPTRKTSQIVYHNSKGWEMSFLLRYRMRREAKLNCSKHSMRPKYLLVSAKRTAFVEMGLDFNRIVFPRRYLAIFGDMTCGIRHINFVHC
eukprot:jgi/Psemu1/308808/fgenesh1_kg.447_\